MSNLVLSQGGVYGLCHVIGDLRRWAIRLDRLQTDNFSLFLRQQMVRRKASVCMHEQMIMD
jgi:hypothetical protein